MTKPRRRFDRGRQIQSGVTLVELIMFVVIASFVAISMVHAFSGTLRGSHVGKELTQATQLAQQRMEVILGQRKRFGFSGFDASTFDPCDNVPAASGWAVLACQSGAYTTVSSGNFAADACGAGTGTDCREITVTVTGPNGDVLTSLTQQVWDY